MNYFNQFNIPLGTLKINELMLTMRESEKMILRSLHGEHLSGINKTLDQNKNINYPFNIFKCNLDFKL